MSPNIDFKVLPDIPDGLLAQYQKEKAIAVDTEMQGLRLGRDEVCLVQISDAKQQACLVRPQPGNPPPNLKKLLTDPNVIKVFHYAITDAAFLKVSLGITVTPFRCTKVMSKLARTYTEKHSLKMLVSELAGLNLDKENQSTDWSKDDLSKSQLQYAANDVLHLLKVYTKLENMLAARGNLPSGVNAAELNERTQAFLPTLVDLFISGYGDRDNGWETSVLSH